MYQCRILVRGSTYTVSLYSVNQLAAFKTSILWKYVGIDYIIWRKRHIAKYMKLAGNNLQIIMQKLAASFLLRTLFVECRAVCAAFGLPSKVYTPRVFFPPFQNHIRSCPLPQTCWELRSHKWVHC
jgi:hypothetical protein